MTIQRGTYDATELTNTPRDSADVLIVGAGPSGAVYAKYLAGWGFHVVCLEQGDWVGTAEYTGNRDEYEVSMYGQWHKNGNVRKRPEDYPVSLGRADVVPVMYNAVGGGTIHYGGQFPRLVPSDFRVKTMDGVAEDWPISYEELAEYYDQTEQEFAVSGMVGDPSHPDGAAPPNPALPINRHGRKLAEGLNKQGISWWPAPNAITQKNFGDLVPCVRYGTCEAGCPNGSKASVDITHWPAALRSGATLVTGAWVSQITTDASGLATGATFFDRKGTERHIRADVVVLAANGIGTPRLLLNSTSKVHPDGLANSSGLVGRNLMLHPNAMAIGVFEEQMKSWIGPAGQNIHTHEYLETDPSRGFVRGAKWLAMPTGGPLVAADLVPRQGKSARGEALLKDVQNVLGKSILLAILTEDLPNPENRVTLHGELTDQFGIPAPHIEYRRDENSMAMVEWNLNKAKEVLLEAGATDVYLHDVMPDQPGHLLGTARMGHDPQTSVTDSFGRTHDVENLWIADGSLFVTSGASNPTNTIAALALRGATELVRRASEMEDAA
ncbi:GMC family oxidoreductase [Leucobacter sp. GX24907]